MFNIEEKKGRNPLKNSGELEVWSCNCSIIGTEKPINARCLNCGSTFKKTSRAAARTRAKVRMDLVNTQLIVNEPVEENPCLRCSDTSQVRVFTQEWDRIKNQKAPCPVCCPREWLEWSAGKRILPD